MYVDTVRHTATSQANAIEGLTNVAGSASSEAEQSILPDPMLDLMSCGDPIEQIAAMMTRSFREDRKQARQSAALEEKHIMMEGRKRVRAMRDKADAVRKEAYVSGGTKLASGAMTIEAGAQFFEESSSLAADDYQLACKGTATATQGVGEMVSGSFRGEQGDLEADAAQHETLARAAERRADEYRDQARDARETLNKIADFLREAGAAQDNASKAAILRA